MLLAFIGLRFLFKTVGFHRDSSFFHRKCEMSMSIDDHAIARDWLPLNTWISTHIVFFFFSLSLSTLHQVHISVHCELITFFRVSTWLIFIEQRRLSS